MRFRKFLKPYKTRGSSFREHTEKKGGDFQRKAAATSIPMMGCTG